MNGSPRGPAPRPRRHGAPDDQQHRGARDRREPGAGIPELVDEIGFAPLDATGSQLLFRFVAAAYERRSPAIASHFSFEEWGRLLPEHTMPVSLLDRFLHHAVVCLTEGESYRMREARERPASGGRPG